MNQDIYFLDKFDKEIRVGDFAAYIKTESYSYAKGRVHSIVLNKYGSYDVVIECLFEGNSRVIGQLTRPVSSYYVFKLEF